MQDTKLHGTWRQIHFGIKRTFFQPQSIFTMSFFSLLSLTGFSAAVTSSLSLFPPTTFGAFDSQQSDNRRRQQEEEVRRGADLFFFFQDTHASCRPSLVVSESNPCFWPKERMRRDMFICVPVSQKLSLVLSLSLKYNEYAGQVCIHSWLLTNPTACCCSCLVTFAEIRDTDFLIFPFSLLLLMINDVAVVCILKVRANILTEEKWEKKT